MSEITFSDRAIVKIGGSIITGKTGEIDFACLAVLAEEMTRSALPIIVVHGGGSITKRLLIDHNVKFDFLTAAQSALVRILRNTVRDFNNLIVSSFRDVGLCAVAVPPRPFLHSYCSSLTLSKAYIRCLDKVIRQGGYPILCGDVLDDKVRGYYFCSGDQLVSRLAAALKPSKVLFLTNVDGVYSDYPPTASSANPLSIADQTVLNQMTRKYFVGHGEIYDKLNEAVSSAKHTKHCRILNGKVPGNLIGSLLGTTEVGTLIEG